MYTRLQRHGGLVPARDTGCVHDGHAGADRLGTGRCLSRRADPTVWSVGSSTRPPLTRRSALRAEERRRTSRAPSPMNRHPSGARTSVRRNPGRRRDVPAGWTTVGPGRKKRKRSKEALFRFLSFLSATTAGRQGIPPGDGQANGDRRMSSRPAIRSVPIRLSSSPLASHERWGGRARLPPSRRPFYRDPARQEPRPTGFMAGGQVRKEPGTLSGPADLGASHTTWDGLDGRPGKLGPYFLPAKHAKGRQKRSWF